MNQIFPKSQMPFDQQCLLLYFFRTIIEEDITHCYIEYKELWFQKWKDRVNKCLKCKKNELNALNILNDKTGTLANIIDNLHIKNLYDEIECKESNIDKPWALSLYRQCLDFEPYESFDSLLQENEEEKEFFKSLHKKNQTLGLSTALDQEVKETTLKEIADYLHINPQN